MTRLAILMTASLMATSAAQATNLIINGDFEAGNTGFRSDYGFITPGPNELIPEGRYTVDTRGSNSHPRFSDMGDQGTGTGKFLIVNGSPLTNQVAWAQSVNLIPGKDYTFSFWLSSVFPDDPAVLSLSKVGPMGAVALGRFPAPARTGVWQQFSATFRSTATQRVMFQLVDDNVVRWGNDFGVDSISLTAAAIPEPASWAMLIAGFGLVGASLRRRPVVVTA